MTSPARHAETDTVSFHQRLHPKAVCSSFDPAIFFVKDCPKVSLVSLGSGAKLVLKKMAMLRTNERPFAEFSAGQKKPVLRQVVIGCQALRLLLLPRRGVVVGFWLRKSCVPEPETWEPRR